MEFWTIEVVDGTPFSARRWQDTHQQRLIEAALTHGAKDWTWVSRPWGVLLEVAFPDESDWLRFRATPAVRSALDAAPVDCLFLYSGRGGGSAAGVPRRPRPIPAAGAASLPLPEADLAPLQRRPGLREGRFQAPTGPPTIAECPEPSAM